MFCIVCGRRPGERPIEPLPEAMSPDLGLCSEHAARYRHRGAHQESDRLLSQQAQTWAPQPRMPTCLHCGTPVLFVSQHAQPLWCQSCERERQQLL